MSFLLTKAQKEEDAIRLKRKEGEDALYGLAEGFRTGKLVLGAEVFLNALDPDLIQRLTEMSLNVVSPTNQLNNRPSLDVAKAKITEQAKEIAAEYQKVGAKKAPPPRADGLPPGWTKNGPDDDGDIWYTNEEQGLSQFEKPTGGKRRRTRGGDLPKPPGHMPPPTAGRRRQTLRKTSRR